MPSAIRVPALRVKEVDGAPDVLGVETITVTNGTLTDNTGGAVTLAVGGSTLTVTEEDNNPSVAGVTEIRVTNGTLTDNTGGSVSIAIGAGGAPSTSTYWVEDADGGLSNEVVVGTTGITTTTYAGIQAAAKAGRLFLPSDGFKLYRDTGAAWAPWGPLFPFVAPISGDYAWLNQGGAAVSTTNGGIHLSIPASASISFRGRDKAKAAAYTITAAILPALIPANTVDTLGLYFSDGTQLHTFGVGFSTGVAGSYYLLSAKWNTTTSFSANYTAASFSQFGPVVWLRIADTGVNRVCSISSDGQNFLTFHTIGRTDFLTATRVGFGGSVTNASNAAGITLLSWQET